MPTAANAGWRSSTSTPTVWHCYLPDVESGQRYGYRMSGPHDPARGLRANPNKLLLDPHAEAIEGDVTWDPSLFAYPARPR
jgi:glycogen operon protein